LLSDWAKDILLKINVELSIDIFNWDEIF
jgi:hypothetical protein